VRISEGGPLLTTRSVEELLGEVGLTRFQKLIIAVSGFAWTFVAMEILLISFVLPTIQGEWKFGELIFGVLASATLVGSFIGSIVLGRISDRRGRRIVFQLSVLWYSIFTALTAVSWNVESLFALRLLAGLGLGGMLVVDPAMLSEFLPPQSRGRFLVFLDFFWPIGFFFALLLSYYFLAILGNDWRLLFVAAAFPAFIAFIFRRMVPESPYYLARSGRIEEAGKVLSKVTGRLISAADIKPEASAQRMGISSLFSRNLLRSSGVTIAVWIALNFSYYGLFLWLPTVLPTSRGFDPGNVYVNLVYSAIAQFPGYLTSMYLVERWGRRNTLATFLILGGLSGYVFATATSYATFIAGLFFVSFFNLGAWGAVYPYTAELYPTQLRATGFGLAEGVGKTTAILAPIVFGLLLTMTENVIAPLTSVAILMLLGGLVAVAVGRETKGKPFT
jgi:putative MFS transporter